MAAKGQPLLSPFLLLVSPLLIPPFLISDCLHYAGLFIAMIALVRNKKSAAKRPT
jgi:hypothetical protein